MTHIRAKSHVAPPPPPPPVHHTEHEAHVTVSVAKDKSRVTGSLPRMSQAKTQPLQALPWEAKPMDGWMGALRGDFLTSWHATTQQHTATVLDKVKGKLTPAGEAAVKTLQDQGKLNKGWLHETVTSRLEHFLKHGGHKDLESAALEELASPDKIKQVRPDSCAAADIQRDLATKQPGKYIAVVNQLIQGKSIKLHGHTLQVSASNLQEIKSQHLKGTQLVDALFQSAAMDAANGKAGYDFKHDETISNNHGHIEREKGLSDENVQTLDQIVGAAPVVTPKEVHHEIEALRKKGVSEHDAKKQVLENQLAKAQAGGQQGVMFAVRGDHAHLAHAVIVTKIENGDVTYVDGHQRQKTVPESEFLHHMCTHEHVRIGSGITWGSTSSSTPSYAAPTGYYAPPPTATFPWQH
ncbi:MAG TPA: hypothetical protein V6D47_05495 [Oscillatoriaceae cyanobacterium]